MVKFKSVFAQAIHCGGLGIYLLLFPEIMFDLLQLNPLTENWIRVLGLFLISVGVLFYNVSILADVKAVKLYMFGTFFFTACITLMVFLFLLPFAMLIVVVTNTILPIWTYLEIRKI